MSDQLPFGSLERLHAKRIHSFEGFSTLDLLGELSARFSSGDSKSILELEECDPDEVLSGMMIVIRKPVF
jgi:hypothetical protein